jgi:hypothetical protein
MRGEVQYALSLAHWLELESRRRSSPAELWPDFVFAAKKLGFDSMKLTLQDEYRVWQRLAGPLSGAKRRYDCPNGLYGTIEFTAPACPRDRFGRKPFRDCDSECGINGSWCLANARVFETISDLLAESWSKSAVQWSRRQLPLCFNDIHPKCASEGSLIKSKMPTRLATSEMPRK